MAFPTTPNTNDTHVIGSQTYIWNGNGWAKQASAAETAAQTPFSPAGDITATDTQAAIEQLQTKVDTGLAARLAKQLKTATRTGDNLVLTLEDNSVITGTDVFKDTISGQYVGTSATFAGLPSGGEVSNGDWAILNVDDSTNQRGIYMTTDTGTTWALVTALDDDTFQTATQTPFTPVGNIAATDVQAAITELDAEKFKHTNGAAPHASPNPGDTWHELSSSIVYKLVNDGTSNFWKEI